MRSAIRYGLLLAALSVTACSSPRPVPAPVATPAPAPMAAPIAGSPVDASGARFANGPRSGFVDVAAQPVSTVSIAGGTASYAIARRFVSNGALPPGDAIRPEEFLNAFRYGYPEPASAAEPFRVTPSLFPAPWNPEHRILHVGVQAHAVRPALRPDLNVVFLIDVSGSMQSSDKLELVKRAIRDMLPGLEARDRVSVVTYAAGTAVVLDGVPGDRRAEIAAAVSGLAPAGGTAGEAGLQRAYETAVRHYRRDGVNRVVLATDGDFNLGISGVREIEAFIAEKRATGVYLTALGVGLDNLNEGTMHTLARAGNGIYVYAGTPEDARRALVDDFAANVVPVANDAKLQVEFDRTRVARYRLLGYETRAISRESFSDDRADGGEVGSGQAVTAVYEIVPATARASRPGSAATVSVRYKLPGQTASRLIRQTVLASGLPAFSAASEDARFAPAVAAFAARLRGGEFLSGWEWSNIADAAQDARGADPDGRREEFVRTVRQASALRR